MATRAITKPDPDSLSAGAAFFVPVVAEVAVEVAVDVDCAPKVACFVVVGVDPETETVCPAVGVVVIKAVVAVAATPVVGQTTATWDCRIVNPAPVVPQFFVQQLDCET